MKKSGVENFNGLIRKIYPKGFDFSTVSQDEIDNEIKKIIGHFKLYFANNYAGLNFFSFLQIFYNRNIWNQ